MKKPTLEISPKGVIESSRRVLFLYHPKNLRERGLVGASILLGSTLLVVIVLLGVFWGQEPDLFDVKQNIETMQNVDASKIVTGQTTVATLIRVVETLLDKPGGYQSNDKMPPTVFMDNIPNWELGVLLQSRDLARALRNDISRSQSQSTEDPDLAKAEPLLNFRNNSWIFPATETEYRDSIAKLNSYVQNLGNTGKSDAQFYARADNLREWLLVVGKRLGSLSQRLSASVGQTRVNTDLGGDAQAKQSTKGPAEVTVQTPWLEVDDIFYEARGSAWALIHYLEAVEIDFWDILQKKNAVVSLRQIIRELKATQGTTWSPVVLNGGGFSVTANYSLTMASYISRANTAVIELRNLLSRG